MPDLIRRTVCEQIKLSAERFGVRTAFAFPKEGKRLSYAELDAATDATARALLALGLGQGSHIGIWGPNTSRWLVLALAAAKIGVVFVPLNTSYRFRELSDIVERADVDCLFVMDQFKGEDCWEISRGFRPRSAQFPQLAEVISMGLDDADGRHRTWASFARGAAEASDETLARAQARIAPEDDYIIQYTSGTTARPKGVVLSQFSALNMGAAFGQIMGLHQGDVTCVPLPLFHCYGNVLTLLSGLVVGAATVYLPHFRTGDTLAALEEERCTVFQGVPTMHLALVNAPERATCDLGALTKGGIGGDSCPPAVVELIAAQLGMPQLTQGYGLSEAASLCLISDVTDTAEHRMRTVGYPVPGTEAMIWNSTTGAPAARGTVGEILVRGMGVMKGYYKAPDLTAATIDADGWLHTGDLGKQNPDGSYQFTGRIKDIIIRGGENISPSEIEELMTQWDGVSACQCVGVPDRLMGEDVACCLIPVDGRDFSPSAVRAYVASRLASFKVPKHVLTMDSFPLNAAGKVVKSELALKVAQMLGLPGEL
ncbi:MAG: AMP-binding protein [Bifidobacteriaceae bacterium]|jgi:acyl-CoA synthetase (AMP-forming)/AMP-acid ligase II|nr:AMP-binding protein [Bifidobacteriaceae bacterium]